MKIVKVITNQTENQLTSNCKNLLTNFLSFFKIFQFVLCTLLATIKGVPTQQGVDTVAVAIENESKPQAIPVPVEQVLKATVSESNDKDVSKPQAIPVPVEEVLKAAVSESNDKEVM